MPTDDRMQTGPEGRDRPRSSMFLSAVLRTETEQVTVRIRNMSANGAMIEAPVCPSIGTQVQLIRGSLITFGEVVWSADGQCGLCFASELSVKDWLAAPSKIEQQRVDEIVSLVKAGAIPVAFGDPAPKLGASSMSGQDAASQLEDVVGLLLALEDDLASSSETLERHGGQLQNLDIAVQILRATANNLAGIPHGGASLEDLRTVCTEALGRRVRKRRT